MAEAVTDVDSGPADTTGPAGSAPAEQPTTGPAGTAVAGCAPNATRTGDSHAAGATPSAVAPQPGRAAVAAVLTRRARPAVAAVAVEPAAGAAGLAGPRCTVGTVTDQRAPSERQHGVSGQGLRLLHWQRVEGLGRGVLPRAGAHERDELLMEQRRLCT